MPIAMWHTGPKGRLVPGCSVAEGPHAAKPKLSELPVLTI